MFGKETTTDWTVISDAKGMFYKLQKINVTKST